LRNERRFCFMLAGAEGPGSVCRCVAVTSVSLEYFVGPWIDTLAH